MASISCQRKSKDYNELNYYHWQSHFNLEKGPLEILEKSQTKKLYTRLFDVVWSPQFHAPVPVSAIDFKTGVDSNYQIVPTIYITNEVMKNL